MAAKKQTIAIAIIAILVIILIVAFVSMPSLGGMLTGVSSSSACAVQSGYSCGSLIYNHTTGKLSATLGQSTGYNWAVVEILFVPQGTALSNGVPQISWNNATSLSNGLANGTVASVLLPASGAVSSGTAISGTIWARYSLEVGGNENYVQLGAINNLHAK
jgi:hypothetical protein